MINALRGMIIWGERTTLKEIEMTGMQTMARYMWAPFVMMGFLMVLTSLGFGGVLANFASDYFGLPKAVREGTDPGVIDKAQFLETTRIWLPAFKLLGIGLLLGGITFLLATILGTLRVGGATIQKTFGREPLALKPPITGRLFPMLMMAGLMVLVTNLAISIVIAIIAHGVYDNSIAEAIKVAPSGSALSDNLQTVQTYKTWLEPFKFVGIALLLTGIALAVHTILQVLRFQSQRLREMAAGK